MAYYDDQPLDEELYLEDEEQSSSYFRALTFLGFSGWYVIITLLLAYQIWKQIISRLFMRWWRKRQEENQNQRERQDSPVFRNRDIGRLAAVERAQRKYDEDTLRMKKIAEEREERRRHRYYGNLPNLNPGRKLNESYEDYKQMEEPGFRFNRRTNPPPDNSDEIF